MGKFKKNDLVAIADNCNWEVNKAELARSPIYESRQGERTDLDDLTSTGDQSKLSRQQQTTIRAANRAAEAIPVIGELLDRGLISIDIAAKLGRHRHPDIFFIDEGQLVD